MSVSQMYIITLISDDYPIRIFYFCVPLRHKHRFILNVNMTTQNF